MVRKLLLAGASAGAIAAATAAGATPPQSSIALELLSQTAGPSEISAFASGNKRLFVVPGADGTGFDMFSLADPANPGLIATISGLGAPNSIAVKHGIVAVAVAADPATDPGKVAFFNTKGAPLRDAQGQPVEVTVGALPDMLTFTKDGKKVLVANEGEPDGDTDPQGSVSIIDLSNGVANATVQTAGFTAFDGQEVALRAKGVRLFPGKSVSEDVEPEYITISQDGKTAWVTLQEANALAIVDIASATVTDIVPLGLKNHALGGNDLDPSDRDGPSSGTSITIGNWPVFGMYMPDAIASFTARGKTWLVTANEGDDRGENERIKDLVLDPTEFPNAAALQVDAAIGRLGASSIDGDTNGNGDYDQLQVYGARSFTVWDSDGAKVWDSGDDFERITATEVPASFNSDGTAATFDTRSDNKGPEPEGITVGRVAGRTFAFIGLERVGGVMVYDVTNPKAPVFVTYEPSAPGDVGPEGVLFIPAYESPLPGTPLLVLTNEVSGTTAVYKIISN
jgi:hypothetical protein